jgi:hypothetical protein
LASTSVLTLVERAPCPGAVPGDVIVISDGTAGSRVAVRAAGEFLRGARARPILFHAGRRGPAARRELAEQATTLYESTGAKPVPLGGRGSAARDIVAITRKIPVAAVVVGVSPLGLELARLLDCSVLVVP